MAYFQGLTAMSVSGSVRETNKKNVVCFFIGENFYWLKKKASGDEHKFTKNHHQDDELHFLLHRKVPFLLGNWKTLLL